MRNKGISRIEETLVSRGLGAGLVLGVGIASLGALGVFDSGARNKFTQNQIQHLTQVNQYLRVKETPYLDNFIVQYYQEHPEVR